MGILTCLLSRNLENPSNSLSRFDEFEPDGGRSDAGVMVTAETALTYSTVWRGVCLISRDVAKLPIEVLKRVGEGKDRDATHPAYPLLRHKTNRENTAYVFKQVMQARAVFHGNAYAYILRRSDGTPTELIPLNPAETYPVREAGRLWYVTKVGETQQRRLMPQNVFHLRGPGDELEGWSLIEKAKQSIGLGLATQKYGNLFFGNGARPGMVLEHPQRLSPEAKKALREGWERMHKGLDSSHRVAVLEEGMKASPMSVNNDEAQFIETRKFSVVDIANWFGVPPHKLGDSSRVSYNSLEQENQSYLNEAIDPWLVSWESEAWEKLLAEEQKREDSYIIEFNRNAMVRADMQARFSAYGQAIKDGWMNRNEARNRENMNPVEGLDGYLVPLNMAAQGDEPDVTPPDEPAPAPDETEELSALPAAVEAHRKLLADACRRACRYVATKAVKAAKKPERFNTWLTEELETDNRATIVEAMEPSVEAAVTVVGCECDTPMVVSRMLDVVRETLGALESVPPAELQARVSSMMDEITATYPARLANELTTLED